MKQSEIDKALKSIARAVAKQHGWKCVAGQPYWTTGPLFFDLGPLARAKTGQFSWSLRVKWLELDRLLWQVLDLSSNEAEPFSLHANGAFVLTGQEVAGCSSKGHDWSVGELADQVELAAQLAGQRAQQIAEHVTTIDAYIEFLQRTQEAYILRYPNGLGDVWTEMLLVALLKNDRTEVRQIARARIAADDEGRFYSKGLSFYERALLLCDESDAVQSQKQLH